MISDIPDHTRHAINVASPVTVGASAVMAAITLNQVAVVLTIISVLLNIVWMVAKFIHAHRSGEWDG